jgi:hypothetical protein
MSAAAAAAAAAAAVQQQDARATLNQQALIANVLQSQE